MAESAAEQLGDDKAKLHAPWGDSENQSDERPEPKKLIINDFDSAYVKLAKSGGHKGLLEYNAAKGSVEAKSYTRPGWFDHEHPCSPAENRDVSATSHLPDYMVYDAPTVPQVNLTPKSEARPPPFSLQDDMSVFKREGKAATDKSVRISGDRRPTRRHADKIWNPEPAKPVKPLQASLTSVHDKIPKKHMPPAPYEVEPVNMAKLLAGDYQKSGKIITKNGLENS
ncbi:PREDICTED: uncharacterized protein C7orf57-like [Priapulus caudatus]|uniref:Uncharacterized protein C7orf57-like n=1 Tax=Priapulus caudatus TaxID=37621 RepID=A0ABM1E232_PRICU|nr:PREDICTED: uncharacterized protein C7orf57-like [Priapulus caudatus]